MAIRFQYSLYGLLAFAVASGLFIGLQFAEYNSQGFPDPTVSNLTVGRLVEGEPVLTYRSKRDFGWPNRILTQIECWDAPTQNHFYWEGIAVNALIGGGLAAVIGVFIGRLPFHRKATSKVKSQS
ncbi:MAG: hypothetical protein AMXMBFR7_34110 [Planctomycetota bacterium]